MNNLICFMVGSLLVLSACSPAGIRITEEVIEEVAEEELKRKEDNK